MNRVCSQERITGFVKKERKWNSLKIYKLTQVIEISFSDYFLNFLSISYPFSFEILEDSFGEFAASKILSNKIV